MWGVEVLRVERQDPAIHLELGSSMWHLYALYLEPFSGPKLETTLEQTS